MRGHNVISGISRGIGNPSCSGCSACENACPRRCIEMKEDIEGFLYPVINDGECINCGICSNVCPILSPYPKSECIGTYAVQNQNQEVRERSSSGGVFHILAKDTLEKGGIIFGACFTNDWSVVLSYTESTNELWRFQGSKYVQAKIGDSYRQAHSFLESGREVLFTGTPCQISGLHHYLGKRYPKLITVDIVCHSIPSPLVWKKYIERFHGKEIASINMRDKSTGWNYWKYCFNFQFKDGCEEKIPEGKPYMTGLVKNLITRPSCSTCIARDFRSNSDITIGDLWGVWEIIPRINDNKGTSLVIAHTKQGLSKLQNYIDLLDVDLSQAQKYNSGLLPSTSNHPKRRHFFTELQKGQDVDRLILKYTKEKSTMVSSIKSRLRTLTNLLFHANRHLNTSTSH